MRIKGIVAAAVIFCMLTAFDAFTVPCAVEEKLCKRNGKAVISAWGEGAGSKEPETQYPGKEAPKRKTPKSSSERKTGKAKNVEEFVKTLNRP